MTPSNYAESHSDWDEPPRQGSGSQQSFVQMVFGSCGGVMNVASQVFNTSSVCNGGHTTEPDAQRRSTRHRSPSLRKSEELIEIPEFLAADLGKGRSKHVLSRDDVSALSSHTLDLMAKRGSVEKLHSTAFRRGCAGPPSLTLTEVSEDLLVPGTDYVNQIGMDLAPLSGMVVNHLKLKGGSSVCSDTSVSTLGVDCIPMPHVT
jgi:hypothetical protein